MTHWDHIGERQAYYHNATHATHATQMITPDEFGFSSMTIGLEFSSMTIVTYVLMSQILDCYNFTLF
jgi:hypothetical protein